MANKNKDSKDTINDGAWWAGLAKTVNAAKSSAAKSGNKGKSPKK